MPKEKPVEQAVAPEVPKPEATPEAAPAPAVAEPEIPLGQQEADNYLRLNPQPESEG